MAVALGQSPVAQPRRACLPSKLLDRLAELYLMTGDQMTLAHESVPIQKQEPMGRLEAGKHLSLKAALRATVSCDRPWTEYPDL